MGRLESPYFETGSLKPREKAQQNGISSLEDFELLALLLHTGIGKENVIQFSQRLLLEKGGLWGVFFSTDLLSEKGISKAKGYTLYAIAEILKRLPLEKMTEIRTEDDAVKKSEFYFMNQSTEVCLCLYLDQKKRILKREVFQSDEIRHVYVPMRTILKNAIHSNCSFLLLLHNHPSGELRFSKMDVDFSNLLFEKLLLIDVILLDSLVVASTGHISMRKRRLGPFESDKQEKTKEIPLKKKDL